MKLDSISQLYALFRQYPTVCTDSRSCPPDSIFFALKGDNFNANAFARSALEKGCKFALIDDASYEADERFILVDNVLDTLQKLATFHRRQLATPMISITGTNGKTTTKELIAAVLKEKYNVLYTEGNLNNHIGVPLTLLKLKAEHELAVVEMGANHPEEIKELCEIARPNFGLITNVGKAHLEGFGSFEGVKKTKAELYEYIAKKGRLIFINQNNSHLVEMAYRANIGNKTVEYVQVETLASSPFLEMEIRVHPHENKRIKLKTNLIGTYNAENVLAAATVGSYFSVAAKQIKHGLKNYFPQNNRSQWMETEHNKLIVDAYNANPSSMALSINNFAQIDAPNKLLILGDMLELGEQSREEHQKIVDLIQLNRFKNVLLTGKNFGELNTDYPAFDDVNALSNYLAKERYTDYYVLIKGSRGIKLEQITGNL